MKKFSELPIQEQFDLLRQRHRDCKVSAVEYPDSSFCSLQVDWKENWYVLDTFPLYTVAIIDEKLL